MLPRGRRAIAVAGSVLVGWCGVVGTAIAAEDTGATILTSPPRILASIAPGASSTSSILVVNRERRSAKVLLRVGDLAPDPDSSSFGIVTDVGDAPRGAGAWISVSNTALTLGPGEQRSVPITIRVPADADAGGHYGAIVVETAPDESTRDHVRIQIRLVTHVNVLVPGDVRYDASLTDVRVTRRDGDVLDVRARFTNDGNIQTTPRDARIRVTGPGASRTVRLDIPETIPDGRRDIRDRVRIPSAAGRFRTRIQLRLEDGSVVRSRSVEAWAWRGWVPIAAIGTLVSLLVLLLFVPLVRRHLEFRRLVRAELERIHAEDAAAPDDTGVEPAD